MGRTASASLKWPRAVYKNFNASTLEDYTEAELRNEYSRLRDIAQKRVKRMEGTEWDKTQTYQDAADKFPKIKELKNKSELAAGLSELADFLTDKRSTISGQKAIRSKALKTLHENGYSFVNENNYAAFTAFMDDYARSHKNDKHHKLYASDQIAELFDAAESANIPEDKLKQDFDFWVEHKKELEELDIDALKEKYKKEKKAFTYEELKRLVEQGSK